MRRVAFARLCLAAIGAIGLAAPALATPPQTYEYKIKHAQYGDIGTYSNTIARQGDRTQVASTLRVTVKILGIVLYRREADRLEVWQGERLVAFTSTENKNGQVVEIRGEARGDAFVIHAPGGQVVAPAYIRPSNPWSADFLRANLIMSTSSGKVFPTKVRGGEEDIVAFDGRAEKLRRFEIDSDKREYVWLDRNNVPVAFRTYDEGTTIDFVLSRYPTGEAGLWPAALPDVAQARPLPTQYAEGDR